MNKIIFVLRSLSGGGAERAMLNLAKGLQARGDAVRFYLLQAEGRLLAEARAHFPVCSILDEDTPGARLSSSPLLKKDLLKTVLRLAASPAIARLAHHLRLEHPDLLLSCLWEADLAAGLALRRSRLDLPWVVASQSSVRDTLSNPPFGALRVRFSRSLYRDAAAVIGCSRGQVAEAVRILDLDPARVHTVFNGADPEVLQRQISRPLDPQIFSPRHANLVAIGRLAPVKRFDLLLAAFQGVSSRCPQARLHILGEGPLRASLQRQVARLGLDQRVTLHGFQPDPFNYLKQAAVFVLSSDWETFSNVVGEALLVGTPVVATRCGGPEELIADGQTGLLVARGDPQALETAILRLLADPELRLRIGRNGREAAWPRLTSDGMVAGYEQVFSGLH